MDRGSHVPSYLERALDAVVAGDPSPDPSADDPRQTAIAAYAASIRFDHAQATSLSERALRLMPADADPLTRVLVYAARGIAASADLLSGDWTDIAPGRTPSGDPLADAREPVVELGQGDDETFARYLLAEAALACARVGLSAELPLPDADGFLLREGRPHPFAAVMSVAVARIAAFRGSIDEATRALDGIRSDVPRLALLHDATASLVRGNADDPVAARTIIERLESDAIDPVDRIAVGCWLLGAFGLHAAGETRSAVALLLRAGGDAGLEHLVITDRAWGFDLLISAALDDGDLDAADAWAARAHALAASPIADAAVDRAAARILLARGNGAGARAAAERAARRARAEGRGIEAADAEILIARAAIAADSRGEASRMLQTVADEASRAGHLAATRAAAHELRAVGRRLRPAPGAGWSGLSPREREVARLLLAAHSNGEIAAELYLSPHTVRAHVSRVLAAFGVASRAGLVARVTPASPQPDALGGLTARQRAVVGELATGAANGEIAERLGISAKTVEKHLHDAMRRLGVTSRVGVLRAVSAESPPE